MLVPFSSDWKPAAVAAGVISMHILVAVEVTSLLQRRMPRRWWRRVHGLSLPLFLLASLHTLASGSDAAHPALRIAVAGSLLTFTFLVAYRGVIAVRPLDSRSRASRVAERPAPSRGVDA